MNVLVDSIEDPILKDRVNSILGESNFVNQKMTLNASQVRKITRIQNANLRAIKDSPARPKISAFMSTIQKIITAPCPQLHPSPFKFERSFSAALFNSELLLSADGDLKKLLKSLDYSHTHYGADFRDPKLLKQLLHKNNKWNKLESIITSGVKYNMNPISEQDRISDIDYHINRGNHKSATTEEGLKSINKAYDKEVKYGWQIPILPSVIKSLKNASVTPLGVATQWTINEKNERIIKRRVTHDCTFPGPSGNSANTRVPDENLEDCIYGFTLRRILHEAHQMRFRHKSSKIYATKTDSDAAYRRIHVCIDSALACITIVDGLGNILLRIPFGARQAGGNFSIVSDTVVDLSTEISNDKTWNPKEIHSDAYELIESLPINNEDDEIPFGQAAKLFVPMIPKDIAFDGFIDDIMGLGIENPRINKCLLHAPALAMHILFRPAADKDSKIPRDNIVNCIKHPAEGLLEEKKLILGWLIDFRRFRVHLPKHKLREWLIDIDSAINTKSLSTKTLESIMGRLNHAGYVLPFGKYFLNRLRTKLKNSLRMKFKFTNLNISEIEDLKFWRKLLFIANIQDIDINHITFTVPSITCYSDACEHGMGGYVVNGPAWRYKLPPELVGVFSINLLELIAASLTIQLAIHHIKDKSYPHRILAFTDNSSALNWLHKSNFDTQCFEKHDAVARDLALFCLRHNVSLFPQHIYGKENKVADALSRDFHLSNKNLTKILLSHLPTQVHCHFKIVQHPKDIHWWLHSLSPGKHTKKLSTPQLTRSNLPILTSGETSLKTLELEMYGSVLWEQLTKISSLVDLHTDSEIMSLENSQREIVSREAQWKPPSIMYQRPFVKMH